MGLVHVRFADHGLGGGCRMRVGGETYLRKSTDVNSLTSCLGRDTIPFRPLPSFPDRKWLDRETKCQIKSQILTTRNAGKRRLDSMPFS
jgi:hypothetical protein